MVPSGGCTVNVARLDPALQRTRADAARPGIIKATLGGPARRARPSGGGGPSPLETEGLAKEIEPLTEVLETVALKPKKSNITPKLVALVWRPFWSGPDGTTTSAWEPPPKPSGPQAP